MCFEAPIASGRLFASCALFWAIDQIIVARELTKVHEEWMEGPLETLEAEIGDPRGEFVIVIPPRSVDSAPAADLTDEDVSALFGQITENNRGWSTGQPSENWRVGLVNPEGRLRGPGESQIIW